MKPITINVSIPVYQQYKDYAFKRGRSVAELIREAMDQFIRERVENRPSLHKFRPIGLEPLPGTNIIGEDLMDEMIGHGTDRR